MQELDRRSGTDRREQGQGQEQVQGSLCALHHQMPDIVQTLLDSNTSRETDVRWLKKIVSIFMTTLVIVVTAAFGSIIAINIQYNKDMHDRDIIRNKIAEDVATVKARVDVIEKVIVYLSEKDKELKELVIDVSNNLKMHTWEWQQDKQERNGKK